MLIQEKVNWLIPFSIEFLVSCRIPPIFIKLAVTQLGDLCENIRYGLKDNIEEQDEKECAGKHASKDQLEVPILMP